MLISRNQTSSPKLNWSRSVKGQAVGSTVGRKDTARSEHTQADFTLGSVLPVKQTGHLKVPPIPSKLCSIRWHWSLAGESKVWLQSLHSWFSPSSVEKTWQKRWNRMSTTDQGCLSQQSLAPTKYKYEVVYSYTTQNIPTPKHGAVGTLFGHLMSLSS